MNNPKARQALALLMLLCPTLLWAAGGDLGPDRQAGHQLGGDRHVYPVCGHDAGHHQMGGLAK